MGKISKKFWAVATLFALVGGTICYVAVSGYFLFQKKRSLEKELELASARSVAMFGIFANRIANLELQNKALDDQVNGLNATIDQIETDLATTQEERDSFEKKYRHEKSRMDELNSQINDIQDAADTLQKIEATDDELLMKYSKVYFLNENYAPKSLDQINSEYTYNPKEKYLFYGNILPFLDDMLKDAKDDGLNLKVISAYRSFAEQSSLKSSYTMVYGTGANQFSADQGYSEHQLGTTIDFTTNVTGPTFAGFDQTPEYKWLAKNAYKYGFILSYPQNNAYYQYEPWHWRFVSRDLARYLHDEGKNFYDLDQREINEYKVSFFD